ncbi:MAG TPA: aminotransferase class I/II-fold pyridoxal phosphate-dependent enzyme [Bacteroidota bacterium]|nr:aminotransferase class I/II-fold pyridoxal phosphate-dependent enzyme [Bacteroidota bacterium]
MGSESEHKQQDAEGRYSAETRLIYGKMDDPRWDYSHHLLPPISSSATYRLDTAQRGAQGFMEFAHSSAEVQVTSRAPIYIYDRLGEPNKDMLEENLADAEGGEIAVSFASGMAAISGVLGILTGTGSEIVADKMLYGCTYSLLTNWYPRMKIATTFVEFGDLDEVKAVITPRTRVLYMESPVNPTLRLIDLSAVAAMTAEINRTRSKEERLYTVVDSTFASPFCQRPLSHGIDFVVHSLTKAIGGFGTDIGGVVIGPRWSKDMLMLYRKDFGGVLSAKSAWPVLVQGLPSLPVRMRQMQQSAQTVAEFLTTCPEVKTVRYPGLPDFPQRELALRQMVDFDGKFSPGCMIYFILRGSNPQESLKRAESFINSIARNSYCITLAVSLGNIRTLIEHPGSMTHSAIPAEEQAAKGLDPGGIRLSIGLERPDDVIQDLQAAFKNIH